MSLFCDPNLQQCEPCNNVNLFFFIEKNSVKADTRCQELFMKITNEKECSIFDENSPQYMLWEEQKKQASYKTSKSMRWHPVFIRWRLAIYLKSPSK